MGVLEWVDAGSGFVSNFLPGTPLLLQDTQQGTFVVNFDSPVRGVGAPIQDVLPGAFTAQIRFFDAANTLLGSVDASGTSAGLENGAVPYLGGLSDAQDIQ